MGGLTHLKELQGGSNYPFFIFFSILFMYNLQRLYKYRFSKIPDRTSSWLKTNDLQLLVVSIIAGILSIFFLISSARLSPFTYSILFFSALLSAWYVIPFFKRNLRRIPYLKAPIVALVWTIILVFIPLFQEPSGDAFKESLLFFIYFLALAIPFDIKDLDYDEKNQKTIPQVFGVLGAKLISIALVIIFYVLFSVNHPIVQTNVIFWISQFYFILLVLAIKKNSPITYFTLIDSSMLLLGLGLYLS